MDLIYEQHPARDISPLDTFADITTVPYLGYTSQTDNPEQESAYILRFDGDLTADEIEAVIERISTSANEEAIRKAARDAIATNTAWRENALPQILSVADTIINHANSSAFDKELAKGIKNLANRLGDITQQNNALIRLQLRELDATT